MYEQAAAEARAALDIDSLSIRYSYFVGFISFCAGNFDLAIEQLSKTIELDPSFVHSYTFLAYAYAQKQMRNEAIATLDKIAEGAINEPRGSTLRAIVDAQTGKADQARSVLQTLRRELKPPDFA